MIADIVSNYKQLVDNIPQIIDVSGYRNEFIAKQLNIQPTYFSVKKQRGSWSVDDVQRLLDVIMNEHVKNYLNDFYENILIEKSLTGKALSAEEFEKRMKW
jgi:hypothetical protein